MRASTLSRTFSSFLDDRNTCLAGDGGDLLIGAGLREREDEGEDQLVGR